MDSHNNTVGKESYAYIVAIGISTGGPKLLSTLIPMFNANLSATYVIVQHMPSGFTKSLAERLNTLSAVTVKEAEDGEILKRGYVYIAPGGYQLKVIKGSKPQIKIVDEPPYSGHKPSVNVMLNSLSELQSCESKMLAIIMTGMGSDGQEGVQKLKSITFCKVIAQDETSSTVYGMPKAIVSAGLADYVLPANDIPKMIEKIVGD